MLQAMSRIAVLVPLPFDKAFDYLVPDALQVESGDFVRVPFGSREIYGVVWGEAEGKTPDAKLKMIAAKAEHLPPMTEPMREFIDWVAWYTMAPKGSVLKMALSVPDALHTPATNTHYTNATDAPLTSKARVAIATALADGYARTAPEIVEASGVSAGTIRKFAKDGGLIAHEITMEPRLPKYKVQHKPDLSDKQAAAVETLLTHLKPEFSVSVIDGVTGSGKTEVYFELIEEKLKSEGQTLILLPEIALSVQWLERFKARFGEEPHLWHSSVPLARKRDTWRAIAQGKATVVVGARSALFLPFKNLELIIVDEEHEGSYKQEDGVIYQARDMAVARAMRQKIPIVLASATPSLETVVNVQQDRYNVVVLPARHGGAKLPDVKILDMRSNRPGINRWISEPLEAAVVETLEAKQQAMLFLNRRGFAPLTLCRACGYRFGCPHCSAWLVEHQRPPRLQCHHCDFRTPPPQHCPECGEVAADCLTACGPGVERVAAEAERLFPQARIAQMTSDVLSTPEQAERLITAVTQGEIDLLIGTQMMAKGHHFPNLALVGVVDADMGLAGGDLRAGERCWQLLHQLGGRAGRADIPGKVLLQTYLPEHPVMVALECHDRDGFIELEKSQRLAGKMPPFGKLAAIILEGPKEPIVMDFARRIAQTKPECADVRCIGPAPAPLAILRGKYRYRLLIKAERVTKLQDVLREWLTPLKVPSSVRMKIDIDPYSFL
ncbi:MAG: primosomal protein N' [Rickettsiales bacterium]|nr:primosomal protein N' [Rickettsiales bacterium]